MDATPGIFDVDVDPRAARVLRRRVRGGRLRIACSAVSALSGLNPWTTPGAAAANLLPQLAGRLRMPNACVDVTDGLLALEYSPGSVREKLLLIERCSTPADLIAADDALLASSTSFCGHISPWTHGDVRRCKELARRELVIDDSGDELGYGDSGDAASTPLRDAAATLNAGASARAAGIASEEADLLRAGATVQQRRMSHVYPFVSVCGVVDGLKVHATGPPTIIETKRRKNRFRGVPVEEKVQLETYLAVQRASGGSSGVCIHVENFDEHARSTVYASDPALCVKIREGLAVFLVRLAAALSGSWSVAFANGELALPCARDALAILAKNAASYPRRSATVRAKTRARASASASAF